MWVFWTLLILLMIGFAKLSTIALNRTLALAQPKWVITLTEVIQVLLLPVFLGLVCTEFGNQRFVEQLQESGWSALTPLQTTLIAIGGTGFVLFLNSIFVYQMYRPPQCQIACESAVLDFRQSESERPWQEELIGIGPMRRLAFLPGNEQFSLEVSTQTYVIPRLPKEWDGLSIVHLTDTHFCGAVTRKYFELVCDQAAALEPDLFVFTGDLLDDQSKLAWLPETFGRLKAPLGQFFILGNHDWYLDAKEIREEFQQQGWVDLSSQSRGIQLAGKNSPLILAGDETPWMGKHPELVARQDSQVRVLLSHTPDNLEWARQNEFDLMLSGHTHGGQIRFPIIGPVYSPSRYGCRYASGVFWRDPTLMCVSRGISGREPIRYLCRPELTKIILRTET